MSNVIFICGIHGSGKTTLGKKLSEILNIPFDSASSIIKKMSEQNWDNQKLVKEIRSNQNALLEGINKLYSHDRIIILDGHFTLLDRDRKISYIPIQTFQKLNLSCVITCITTSKLIVERLKERDRNTSVDINTVNLFQEEEINYANKVSKQIGIPNIYHDTTKESINDLVDKIIKGGIL